MYVTAIPAPICVVGNVRPKALRGNCNLKVKVYTTRPACNALPMDLCRNGPLCWKRREISTRTGSL